MAETRFRVPARVVWGGADRFQKLRYGERLAGDLAAPLVRLDSALAALTNGGAGPTAALLERAGLDGIVERVVTVEEASAGRVGAGSDRGGGWPPGPAGSVILDELRRRVSPAGHFEFGQGPSGKGQ